MAKKTIKPEVVEIEEVVVEDIDQYRDSEFMKLVQKVSGFGTVLIRCKMEDLSKKTVPQLKKLAKEIGVKGYSTMTKHLLVAYCQATLEIPNKPTPIGTQRSPFGIGS